MLKKNKKFNNKKFNNKRFNNKKLNNKKLNNKVGDKFTKIYLIKDKIKSLFSRGNNKQVNRFYNSELFYTVYNNKYSLFLHNKLNQNWRLKKERHYKLKKDKYSYFSFNDSFNESLLFRPWWQQKEHDMSKINKWRIKFFKNKSRSIVVLPLSLRYQISNKPTLYNKSINFNNILSNNYLFKNKLSLISKLKSNNNKFKKFYNRFSLNNNFTFYNKELLYYFWTWKLITHSSNFNNLNNNINYTLKNGYLVSNNIFNLNNYFFTNSFLLYYKQYYLNLFRMKRNIKLKSYNKLKNKQFKKSYFWKDYKDFFYKKYKYINQVNTPYTFKNTGVVNIYVTLNNTFVTLSDLNGNVLYSAWAGVLGIKGPKRSTPTASEEVAKKVRLVAQEKELNYVYLKLNGVLYTRKMKSATKEFLNLTSLKILRVVNLTPKAHNGIRKRKIKKI